MSGSLSHADRARLYRSHRGVQEKAGDSITWRCHVCDLTSPCPITRLLDQLSIEEQLVRRRPSNKRCPEACTYGVVALASDGSLDYSAPLGLCPHCVEEARR